MFNLILYLIIFLTLQLPAYAISIDVPEIPSGSEPLILSGIVFAVLGIKKKFSQ